MVNGMLSMCRVESIILCRTIEEGSWRQEIYVNILQAKNIRRKNLRQVFQNQ